MKDFKLTSTYLLHHNLRRCMSKVNQNTQKMARDTTNDIKHQWQLTSVERLKFFIIILETVNPLTPNGAIMFKALNIIVPLGVKG